MTSKPKIFISAYACEPGLGSEIGVGWHWVLEMSRHFELWVLTRKSNQHTIEPWVAEHPEYAGIHFLYFDLPQWAKWWKRGLSGVRTYYVLWQWFANGLVRRTMKENGIELFHHLTYGNALWPVSRWGQQQQFVWGPIGGAETIPQDYSRHYGRKSRLIEWARRLAVGAMRWNLGFRRRCRRAALILCKTEDMRAAIPEKYRSKAILFTDVAVEEQPRTEAPETTHDKVEYLAVGRLDAWRGFDVMLEAFAAAVRRNPQLHLTLLGQGGDGERLKGIIAREGLAEHVSMPGKVDMAEYRRRMASCDVVVNSSLREGAVTVSFDSMAAGKPLLCVDTGGFTRYFSEEYAIVLPRRSRAELVEQMTAAMLQLADAATRERMGRAALAAGSRFTWATKGQEIAEAFNDLIKNA